MLPHTTPITRLHAESFPALKASKISTPIPVASATSSPVFGSCTTCNHNVEQATLVSRSIIFMGTSELPWVAPSYSAFGCRPYTPQCRCTPHAMQKSMCVRDHWRRNVHHSPSHQHQRMVLWCRSSTAIYCGSAHANSLYYPCRGQGPRLQGEI